MKLKFLLITLFGTSIAFADNYQVCFTPGENCTQDIVNAINSAKATINVQAYNFTSTPIAEALINAKARGVKGPKPASLPLT